jgi:hypothetical protein
VRGMLSDRARTELSVAVDIFQESLLYTCITKESDRLMSQLLVSKTHNFCLMNEGFYGRIFRMLLVWESCFKNR